MHAQSLQVQAQVFNENWPGADLLARAQEGELSQQEVGGRAAEMRRGKFMMQMFCFYDFISILYLKYANLLIFFVINVF